MPEEVIAPPQWEEVKQSPLFKELSRNEQRTVFGRWMSESSDFIRQKKQAGEQIDPETARQFSSYIKEQRNELDTPKTSTLGAAAISAAMNTAPSLVGIVTGAGGSAAGMYTGPAAPVAVPALGIAGGMAGSQVTAEVQDKILEKILPESVYHDIKIYERDAQEEHPISAFFGSLVPQAAAFRPSISNVSRAAGTARQIATDYSTVAEGIASKDPAIMDAINNLVNVGLGAGVSGAQEAYSLYEKEDPEAMDYIKAGLAFVAGAALNKPTSLGRKLSFENTLGRIQEKINPISEGEAASAKAKAEEEVNAIFSKYKNPSDSTSEEVIQNEEKQQKVSVEQEPLQHETELGQVKPEDQLAKQQEALAKEGEVIPPPSQEGGKSATETQAENALSLDRVAEGEAQQISEEAVGENKAGEESQIPVRTPEQKQEIIDSSILPESYLKSASAEDLISNIAQTSENEGFKRLTDFLKGKLGDVKLNLDAQFTDRSAQYDPKNKSIDIDLAHLVKNQSLFEQHAIHEALHSKLVDVVHNAEFAPEKVTPEDAKLVSELKSILEKSREALIGDSEAVADFLKLKPIDFGKSDTRNLYGLTNLHEFIAEIMTNDKFQKLIKNVDRQNGGNLWTRFVEAIKGYLGIPKRDDLLNKSIDNVMSLIESQAKAKGATEKLAAPPVLEDKDAPKNVGEAVKSRFQLVKEAMGQVADAIGGIPKFTDLKKSLLKYSSRLSVNNFEVTKLAHNLNILIDDDMTWRGITRYREAGGREDVLKEQLAKASKETKPEFEAALNLDNKQKDLAGKISELYSNLRKRAIQNGINLEEVENYAQHEWKKSAKDFLPSMSGKSLSDKFKYGQQRYYKSYFEGEQKGLTPVTTNARDLILQYMNNLNNVIATRELVRYMGEGKAEDGRPLIAPTMNGITKIEPSEARTGATLISPDIKTEEIRDYSSIEKPAFKTWSWSVKDESGNPVFVKTDVVLHPEAFTQLNRIMETSKLRKLYNAPSSNIVEYGARKLLKFVADDIQNLAKQTMLGFLSPFHMVQEGTHGLGDRINPFYGFEEIDPISNPSQLKAMEHGLMLVANSKSRDLFLEGVGADNRNLAEMILKNTPILKDIGGKKIADFNKKMQDFLFENYIPSLKWKSYQAYLDRNMAIYAKDILSKKVTADDVAYLTARQVNEGYGHLNYMDMTRDPTFQHVMQMFLLAPDFLEARTRFSGRALQSTLGKAGWTSLQSMLFLGGASMLISKALSKIYSDDDSYHWDEPFTAFIGNRKFTVRSVPEDIAMLVHDWRQFLSGRLSPLIGRGALMFLSKRNYRGEEITTAETIRDLIAGVVPLTLQPVTRFMSETTKNNPVSKTEQLLGSLGLRISRFSTINEMKSKAQAWRDDNGIGKSGSFGQGTYTQLRYMLDDGNFEDAYKEYLELKKTHTPDKIEQGFSNSMSLPFTGSYANDVKFKASLSDHDKKLFEDAQARRRLIVQRFYYMLSHAKKETK